MNIKTSQYLVEEAKKKITTLQAKEAKDLHQKGEIKFIDIRDIRELWKEGTIKDSIHIPRGMLEFWLDPESSYYKEKKIKEVKKMVLFCALGNYKKRKKIITFLPLIKQTQVCLDPKIFYY